MLRKVLSKIYYAEKCLERSNATQYCYVWKQVYNINAARFCVGIRGMFILSLLADVRYIICVAAVVASR